MKKILLSLLISMAVSNVHAMNASMMGAEMAVPGVVSTPEVQTNVPIQNENPQPYTEPYTPPVVPYQPPVITPVIPAQSNTVPRYESDPVSPVVEVPTEQVEQPKTKAEIFEDCILKSDQMMEVIDTLKSIPEKERVTTLYESGYWSTLSEQDKEKTLKTLANFTGLDDNQYIIIKGKMADSFKTECLNLIKR